jgi:signal transduction histidine kinase
MDKVSARKQPISGCSLRQEHSQQDGLKTVSEGNPIISLPNTPHVFKAMKTERVTMLILCRTDGRIIALNQTIITFAGLPESNGVATIADLAHGFACAELPTRFATFIESGKSSDSFSLRCRGSIFRATMQTLNEAGQGRQDSQDCLILLELKYRDLDSEQERLFEAGRLTSRLIHDLKNQMGGLKLYAAYLKKRFADQPEGLEIVEKIVEGLNTMAEHASLVSRLTRPLELKREPGDPSEILDHVINDQRSRAGARSVKIETKIENGLPPASFDAQQLRTAIGSILTRAIESSAEGGLVRIELQSKPGEMQIEVSNQGEALSGEQRAALFDLLAADRIGKTSLDMALARRIIEYHGGEVMALAASTDGTVVRVILPISEMEI